MSVRGSSLPDPAVDEGVELRSADVRDETTEPGVIEATVRETRVGKELRSLVAPVEAFEFTVVDGITQQGEDDPD